MAITSDFHLHSSFSGDSSSSMEYMIESAIKKGLQTICFTEHHDIDYPENPAGDGTNFLCNADSYLYELLRCREKYQDSIHILFGIELGMQPHLVRENLQFSKAHPFDFILASSHICNGKDPFYPEFFSQREEEAAYLEYFESILANIACFSNFDVYGHLDYVVRYGPNQNKNYSYDKYKDILDSILESLLKKEKGIEVNTGGFKYGLGEPNPCIALLKRYRELGGEILTIGSDAHEPSYMGYHFDKTCDLLKECGFSYYTIFEYRMPEFKKL